MGHKIDIDNAGMMALDWRVRKRRVGVETRFPWKGECLPGSPRRCRHISRVFPFPATIQFRRIEFVGSAIRWHAEIIHKSTGHFREGKRNSGQE